MAIQTAVTTKDFTIPGDPPIRSIFAFWSSIETQIAATMRLEGGGENTMLLDQLTDAQSELITLMTQKNATTLNDVFFKLAVWRLENFGSAAEGEEDLTRTERLAVSAFADLARMLGKHDFIGEFFEEISHR